MPPTASDQSWIQYDHAGTIWSCKENENGGVCYMIKGKAKREDKGQWNKGPWSKGQWNKGSGKDQGGKGRGGDKGHGEGYDNGNGKGLFLFPCHGCGEVGHRVASCPMGKGGGKSKGSLATMEDPWDDWPERSSVKQEGDNEWGT